MVYLRGSQTVLPASGRPYSSGYKTISKRIAKLERVQSDRAPEIKHATSFHAGVLVSDGAILFDHISSISEGTSAYQRSGDEVKIKRVEISGTATSTGVDFFLLLSKNTITDPTSTDFTDTQGCQLQDTAFDNQYRALIHYRPMDGANGNFKMVKNFKYSLPVKYITTSGAGAVQNRLYFIMKNKTGVAQTCSYTARVFFHE